MPMEGQVKFLVHKTLLEFYRSEAFQYSSRQIKLMVPKFQMLAPSIGAAFTCMQATQQQFSFLE